MKTRVEDVACLLIGAVLLVAGAWMVSAAAGMLAAGALLVANAVFGRWFSIGTRNGNR